MRPRLLLFSWLLTDIVLFVLCYLLAYFLRVGWIISSDLPFKSFLLSVMLSALPWLLMLMTTRTFALGRNQQTVRNLSYIAYAAVGGGALVISAHFFLFKMFFSRTLVLIGILLTTLVVWGWHIAFSKLQRRILRRDPPCFPTMIVGVTREAKKLIELMEQNKSPFKPVAILDGTGVKETSIYGVPVLGKLNRLGEVLRERRITHLIQCSELEQSINLLSACRVQGITYMLLPSVLGIVERDERIESIEGKAVTVVGPRAKFLGWFF